MLSCTDSCSVAWITIRIGWRGPKFGDGTHCAIGLRGGAWVQAASAKERRARTARRWMGMGELKRAGVGEAKRRGRCGRARKGLAQPPAMAGECWERVHQVRTVL